MYKTINTYTYGTAFVTAVLVSFLTGAALAALLVSL